MTQQMFQRAGVVIVNYNSAALSFAAALSALGAQGFGRKIRVVIVDNASPDGSFNQLVELAQGAMPNAERPVTDDVRFARIDDLSVAAGAVEEGRIKPVFGVAEAANLILIKSDRNGGFASGCNLGLEFLRKTDTDLFLLQNPDTQLDQNALQAFAARLVDPACGLAGATLLGMDAPHQAQALGGAGVSPLTLLGKNLGADKLPDALPPRRDIEPQLDYPVGAAMAFRRDWLDHAGMMDERYFLFYEELDWVMAGRQKFTPGWAREALVYHHRGAVAGSHYETGHRSALADYHMIRSRFLFALKWRPWLLPVLCALAGVQALRRILRGQGAQARAVLRGTIPGAPRAFSPDV